MATNAEVVSQLEASKDVLQAQCDAASGAQVLQLMTLVHRLSDEIGNIEAQALDDADYVPQSDCFRKETDEAKAFLNTLASVKSAFAAADQVAKAVDTVIGIVSKL